MKQALLKLLMLALYLSCAAAVFMLPDLLSGMARLIVLLLLGYSGLIVLAQLSAALKTLSGRRGKSRRLLGRNWLEIDAAAEMKSEGA